MFTAVLVLAAILVLLWFAPIGNKKSPTVGVTSNLPTLLQPATSASTPFQQNLDEEASFLVEAYREKAMAEKKAEVAEKATKYFTKSE